MPNLACALPLFSMFLDWKRWFIAWYWREIHSCYSYTNICL